MRKCYLLLGASSELCCAFMEHHNWEEDDEIIAQYCHNRNKLEKIQKAIPAKMEVNIFHRTEERMEMLEEAKEASPKLLSNMNAAIAEYGEDLLEALEEQMEQLECMEVVDPHMSEEDLKELKRKHRAAEDKAMMKADMDYLKGMIKHMQDKAGAVSSSGAIQSTSGISMPSSGLLFAAATDYNFEAPSEPATVDIAL